MKKWFLVPLFLLLAAVMIFSSCGGQETTAPTATTAKPTTTAQPGGGGGVTAPEPYGTITIANTDFSYESTDPIFYESFWGWSMYDNLITYDENGSYIPNVAESWSISADGNTWTFKIRKDIKFQNGDPLTAEDVKFSVDRFGSDESTNPWSWYLNFKYNKVSSAVIDPYTFQYVTAHPEPGLVVPFAWTRILPKKYFETVGQDEFRKNPVGSGPWKFVEHTPETSFTMEANTAYWGQVPFYKYVKYVQVPEESTQVAMLKRGEVDFITVNMDRLVQLQKAGWRTVDFGLPTVSNINFQGTWFEKAGPTHDLRIRQAMSFSLNRQEICDTYFQGNAVPGGQWFIHPGGYGYTDALAADPYDPVKAKSLMAAAHYPDAWADPTIHIYSTAAGLDYIQLLQGYWTAVGLQVKIEVVDAMVWGGYFFTFNRLTGNEPNVGWIFAWTFGSTFNNTYHCANMYTAVGAHNTSNDVKAGEMYNDATSELDPAKALKKWQDFQVYVRTLYVDVGIAQIRPLMVVGPNVGKIAGPTWMSLADALNYFEHP